MSIYQYLDTATREDLHGLWQSPWCALAVFQSLEPLAQHVILRLLGVPGYVSVALLRAWVKPTDHALEAFDRVLKRLLALQVLGQSPVGDAAGGARRRCRDVGGDAEVDPKDAVVMSSIFAASMQAALTTDKLSRWEAQAPSGGGSSASSSGAALARPAPTIAEIERYGEMAWTSILHFLVGTEDAPPPDPRVVEVLVSTGLLAPGPAPERLSLTDDEEDDEDEEEEDEDEGSRHRHGAAITARIDALATSGIAPQDYREEDEEEEAEGREGESGSDDDEDEEDLVAAAASASARAEARAAGVSASSGSSAAGGGSGSSVASKPRSALAAPKRALTNGNSSSGAPGSNWRIRRSRVPDGTPTRYADILAAGGGETHVTRSAYGFLLQDTSVQLWTFTDEYVRSARIRGHKTSDALGFLFELGFCKLGQGYPLSALSPPQVQLLQDFSSYGLIYVPQGGSGLFYPTSLAVTLTQPGASGLALARRALAQSEALQEAPGTGALTGLAAGSDAAAGRLQLVVEPNFKIYAYTTADLHMALLALFAKIEVRLPNVVVARLTRRSLFSAFDKGITAGQIRHFLLGRVHPDRPVPNNVHKQLQLWEEERRRVDAQPAVMFDSFPDVETLAAFKAHIESISVDEAMAAVMARLPPGATMPAEVARYAAFTEARKRRVKPVLCAVSSGGRGGKLEATVVIRPLYRRVAEEWLIRRARGEV